MARFSYLTANDAYAMERRGEIVFNPETPISGAAYVERADDNGGTFVLNAKHEPIAFVSIGHTVDGNWLYYSADVVAWLNLTP